MMLVDLGYNGTVQNHIATMLRERFDVETAGRYLLLREEQISGLDKKGLFDVRNYDIRALHALSGPIAVLEQLCTLAQGSVIDYGPDGAPERKGAGAKGAQNAIRDRVQEACVAFARTLDSGFHSRPASDDQECRRRMAMGGLARLLFMPSAGEVALLESFEHDVNLGTDDQVQLLDVDASAHGLRRRGLLYLNQAERMFLPGEVQPHGMPLSLSLFSVNRFGLELRSADFRSSSVILQVLMADSSSQTMIEVEAHATHDGYYLATIPVGAGRFATGIHFGSLCEWLQLEECAFYPVSAFGAQADEPKADPLDAQVILEGMNEEGQGLFRCTEQALLLAPPPTNVGNVPHLLAVSFRPLASRSRAAMKKAA
jgi:hypothetical protein